MLSLEKWIEQTAMSEPAAHAGAIAPLPSGVGELAGIVHGLLVHEAWLGAYGLDERDYRDVSRTTLPVAERLSRIVERDSRDLQISRQPRLREIGTCRDMALMLCSFLRSKQIPSRVRCGFAAYFGAAWEDHWVCDYWDEQAREWRLCDPQLDSVLKKECRIEFDPVNVPRKAFLTGGEAWLEYRHSRADPSDFGHGTVTGVWFMKVNVVRDHYALNGRETSEWDGWRDASPSARMVGEQETEWLDDLAARPDQPLVTIIPDWLDRD